MASSSGNNYKYEFLTGEDVVLERFEYSQLGKTLKPQADIAKDQYKFLENKTTYVIDNNRQIGDNREGDKSGEITITKEFDATLKHIKNNGRATKSITVKSHDNNINLHSLIIKLLNREKTAIKKIMDLMKDLILLMK